MKKNLLMLAAVAAVPDADIKTLVDWILKL